MSNKAFFFLIAVLSGCASTENTLSPEEMGHFNRMSCEQLKDNVFDLYFKLEAKRSHYAYSKPHLSKFSDVLSDSSKEIQEIEQLRKAHNNAAQAYNNRQCGRYIVPIERDIPMRRY